MSYWHNKRALVTGASSGLGFALVEALAARGARVALVARDPTNLDTATAMLAARNADAFSIPCDVTSADDMARMAETVRARWDGIDFFCHCAGRSMRGEVTTTPIDDFQKLWELNFLAAVRGVQAFAADLKSSRGHIVLVSSLAGKVATRYLGAYPASKFPLNALAQQLRLQLGPDGVHTLLVSPGPIARGDSADRYSSQTAGLPAAAARPGGSSLRPIAPNVLAEKILSACERRRPELILPAKTKLLFALAQLWPSIGDWILLRKSSH